MKWAIYRHTCKANNLVYIGITKQDPPDKRWMNGLGYKDNLGFYHDIERFGWEKGFKHEILIDGILSEEEAKKIEGEIILSYLKNSEYRESVKKRNPFGLKIYNRNYDREKLLVRN